MSAPLSLPAETLAAEDHTLQTMAVVNPHACKAHAVEMCKLSITLLFLDIIGPDTHSQGCPFGNLPLSSTFSFAAAAVQARLYCSQQHAQRQAKHVHQELLSVQLAGCIGGAGSTGVQVIKACACVRCCHRSENGLWRGRGYRGCQCQVAPSSLPQLLPTMWASG